VFLLLFGTVIKLDIRVALLCARLTTQAFLRSGLAQSAFDEHPSGRCFGGTGGLQIGHDRPWGDQIMNVTFYLHMPQPPNGKCVSGHICLCGHI